MKLSTAKKPKGSEFHHKSDRAHEDVKGKSTFTKRIRAHAEALPRDANIWTKELYDGAELRPFEGRPGSQDFLKYPSKGLTP